MNHLEHNEPNSNRINNQDLVPPPEILIRSREVFNLARKLHLHINFHDSHAPYSKRRLFETIDALQQSLDELRKIAGNQEFRQDDCAYALRDALPPELK